jgi:predicted DNA-binding transcriptional regulator AlpA
MTNPILIDHAGLRARGVRIHNSTLLRLEAKGLWPKRVKVGAKTHWLAEEVEQHIKALKEGR